MLLSESKPDLTKLLLTDNQILTVLVLIVAVIQQGSRYLLAEQSSVSLHELTTWFESLPVLLVLWINEAVHFFPF